jgi:carotenoid cleavage dioxygenase
MVESGGRPFDDTRVFKHDFHSGTRATHDFGRGRHAGEFVFVTDPDRSGEEDGGWVLGPVHADGDRTSLVVPDAQDVEGASVAEVRIAYGFHGDWIPDAATA